MQKYELAVLLHPDLEIDIETPLKQLEKEISTSGGKIIKRDDWGKRKLAYPINKHNFAIYFFYVLEMESTKVEDLEQALKLNDQVIRHLVVKFNPDSELLDSDDEGRNKSDSDAEDKPAKAKSTAKSSEDSEK